jgi:hypothetical protein
MTYTSVDQASITEKSALCGSWTSGDPDWISSGVCCVLALSDTLVLEESAECASTFIVPLKLPLSNTGMVSGLFLSQARLLTTVAENITCFKERS